MDLALELLLDLIGLAGHAGHAHFDDSGPDLDHPDHDPGHVAVAVRVLRLTVCLGANVLIGL